MESDSNADELTRLKEENARLKKSLYEKANKDDTVEAVPTVEEIVETKIWGVVGLKDWNPTLSGDNASGKANVPQISLTGGYGSGFVNISAGYHENYSYRNFQLKHDQLSLNLGYQVTSNFAASIGIKAIGDEYTDPSNNLSIMPTDATLTTVGFAYSHKFQDSPYSVSVTGSYGTSAYQAHLAENYTGTTSMNITQTTYDLGIGYTVTKSFKLGAFYRMERWSTFAPTGALVQGAGSPVSANLAVANLTLGGPGISASYAF